ncbi:MAG TPA: DUF5606 domain-containing protein [Chitinophagales bacterium]|nr:DUF5606 domain-containing protein [Chitinophagales bacterium]
MQLSEIVAISGMPGLYKIASRRNDGLIVTSLIDDKTQFVSGRTALFTTLDNITMYTTDEPASLKDVLASVKNSEPTTAVPDAKDEAALKAWLEAVLPNYDKEKVHVSDMKKLAKWYQILNAKGLIEELTTEKTEEKAEDSKEEAVEKKEVKKETKPVKETRQKPVKSDKSSKANTKPAPGAKKITAPRKAQ